MPGGDTLEVEVVWIADGGRVEHRRIRLAAPAVLADALSALATRERDTLQQRISQGSLQPAIYGESCEPDTALRSHDRIELLGPLMVDPKIARRLRVQTRRASAPRDKWSRSR